MERSSRQVSTPQRTTHPRLRDLLLRHRATPWREPLAPHNARAIETLRARLENNDRALVLDSYCGTGQSTQLLALRYPECLVIGIDKSAHRLAKHAHAPNSDYCLVQADCEPLWLFLAQAGYRLKAHYLLYPNPWPKPAHLQRRVHGHPGFSALIALGGRVELRSNWQLYVEEFGLAMALCGHTGFVSRVDASEPLTLFERKYRDSGQDLWSFIANIPV